MIQCFSKLVGSVTGGGTRFCHPLSSNVAFSAGFNTQQSPISTSGTFRNLRVRVVTAGGLGGVTARDFTLYKNAVATALTVTISGTDVTIHEDIVNSVSVVAGDLIALGTTPTGVPANVTIAVAIEFHSDSDYESIYSGQNTTLGTGTTYFNMTVDQSNGGTALAIDDTQSVWPLAGVMTRHDVKLNTAPGGAGTRVFTLYKNGVAQDGSGGTPNTVITVTGATTTGTASFSLSVSPGDLLAIQSSTTGAPSGTLFSRGCLFTATNPGEFAYCMSDQDTVTNGFSSHNTDNWVTTDTVAMMGNTTTWQITGFSLVLSAADNARVFQPSVNGSPAGPSGTLGGGATTLAGSGVPATITSADTWSFRSTSGTSARQVIWALQGQELSADTPGPLTSNPLLRQALIHGGMVQ